ncbi:SRPBCC family protein [Streptomyces smyrnaeus]|uniref:SRPBCC family protein n=1 Tax=Streptomyces smyrnaeus TaxID=1387713 RepID=UPI0036BD3F4A
MPAAINRAFEAFVDGIDSWWPVQNSITRAPQARVTIEPRVGGRWYEESVDGEQCDWGKVLTWDPPHRLVLAWQLQTAIPGITGGGLCHGFWRFEPGMRTEVELRFTTLGPRRTKVDLEHRHLDRFVHPEHARSYLDNDGGWPELLDRYTRAATTQ